MRSHAVVVRYLGQGCVLCNPWLAGQKWPGSWSFVACGKVQILKGYCQSSVGGQRVV